MEFATQKLTALAEAVNLMGHVPMGSVSAVDVSNNKTNLFCKKSTNFTMAHNGY